MSNVVKSRAVLSAVVSTLIVLSPAAAFAHGGGAHGGGHAHFSHTSKSNKDSKDNKDNLNANGKNASDRDKGRARAEDRSAHQAGISDTDDTNTASTH